MEELSTILAAKKEAEVRRQKNMETSAAFRKNVADALISQKTEWIHKVNCMGNWYWFIKMPNEGRIKVCFPNDSWQNMDAFLAMAGREALRRILEDLQNYRGGLYEAVPGEYLELTVDKGWVSARILLFEEPVDCCEWMSVDGLKELLTDYLAEWEAFLAKN